MRSKLNLTKIEASRQGDLRPLFARLPCDACGELADPNALRMGYSASKAKVYYYHARRDCVDFARSRVDVEL